MLLSRHTRRREFITLLGGAAVSWPLTARAQQAPKPIVGFVSGRSLASDAHLVAAFQQGLGEIGYVDGRNVVVEFRWADSQFDRLPTLVADLVKGNAAVIFAGAVDVKIRELNAAISSVPVVFATGGDPVALGLGASYNRPGGNATAVTVITDALWPKRLELVREMVTPATAIAFLVNPDRQTADVPTVQAAARRIGQNFLVLTARSEDDFDAAFATMVQRGVGVLLVADDAIFMNRREKLIALAARHKIPAMYGRSEYPAAGGLMSYGASTPDQYRQSGIYVGRVLKGDKPADLPFLQPTKFELVVNLKTAKGLGFETPAKLLALVDQVIE